MPLNTSTISEIQNGRMRPLKILVKSLTLVILLTRRIPQTDKRDNYEHNYAMRKYNEGEHNYAIGGSIVK